MKYWKTILALVIMPFAFYFDLIEFYFSILFLIWSIQGIRNKNVIFLDYITKNESPLLYWVVTLTWLILALLSLAYSEPLMNWYGY